MSYTPTTWKSGDVVTSAKLNKLEGGVAAANDEFVITCTPTAQDLSGTVDKTNAEIFAAYQAGKKIVIQILGQGGDVANVINPSSFDYYYQGGTWAGVLVNATFVYNSNDTYFLVVATAGGADGTYSTKLFTLTPVT